MYMCMQYTQSVIPALYLCRWYASKLQLMTCGRFPGVRLKLATDWVRATTDLYSEAN